ncbi:MAG: hypothetical protein Q7J54_00160 [Candidatus Woesearchaeota archaeon]|nr:hypothetical protein [Candidatus Woesearchaeota archaeon]
MLVVFLSQQPYFKKYGNDLYLKAKPRIEVYLTKATDWIKNNVYPRVSGEVEQKSAVIQQEINKQKNNIMQNTWEKIKDYFANIFSKVSGTSVK